MESVFEKILHFLKFLKMLKIAPNSFAEPEIGSKHQIGRIGEL
jgi:hypothetical protein